MPAAPVNGRNPLIRILQQGLLDRQTQPETGPDGGLGYGLTGRDVSALKRTCRAANSSLTMTEAHEINHVVRICQGIRGAQAPTDAGVRKAQFFIRGVVEKKCGVGPKQIYQALAEMCLLSTRLHLAKSTPDDRMIAFVFAATMHAQAGHFTNPRHALAWCKHMRAVDGMVYGDFIGRMGQLALAEVDDLAGRTSITYLAYDLIGRAAYVTAHGTGLAKIAAAATMPLWPLAATQALFVAAGCVPLAVGLAYKSRTMARETLAFSQINFYKDAVMFDMLLHPDSLLVEEHDEDIRLTYFDGREPRHADNIGRDCVRRMVDAYCAFLQQI